MMIGYKIDPKAKKAWTIDTVWELVYLPSWIANVFMYTSKIDINRPNVKNINPNYSQFFVRFIKIIMIEVNKLDIPNRRWLSI